LNFLADRKIENSVYFSKIGDLIEDLIDPNELFNIQFYLDRAVYVKFNVSINGKNAHLGEYDPCAWCHLLSPQITKSKILTEKVFMVIKITCRLIQNSDSSKRSIVIQ
jgi:hypothetical protein